MAAAHRRAAVVTGHLHETAHHSRCAACVHTAVCAAPVDIEDTVPCPPGRSHARILAELGNRKAGRGVAGWFFTDPRVYQADLEHIWEKEWLFVGHDVELKEPGSYLTVQAGNCPVLVIRGRDGQLRAFHNICRHRGFKLCDDSTGRVEGKLLSCQYHGWAYDITDGGLRFARDMGDHFDESLHGLKPVQLQTVQTYVFICVAENPPDFEPLRATMDNYLMPYDLANSKVAHKTRIVEKSNWKLTWENNRECYHCPKNHPELTVSFPANWIQSDDNDVQTAERLELPSKFTAGDDNQFRAMRHLFTKGATSMTMTGRPAVNQRLGRMPAEEDVGNAPFYHYPTTWNHWQADYALSFRVMPISPTETEVVTTWLVPAAAVEGVDYDLKALTEVWLATNEQDQFLVERQQKGVSSPAYEPGPYNQKHEQGVLEFVEWYAKRMKERLQE